MCRHDTDYEVLNICILDLLYNARVDARCKLCQHNIIDAQGADGICQRPAGAETEN